MLTALQHREHSQHLPDEVNHIKWIHKPIEGVWNPSAPWRYDPKRKSSQTPRRTAPERELYEEGFRFLESHQPQIRLIRWTGMQKELMIESTFAAINKELVVSKRLRVKPKVQEVEPKHDDMKAGSMMMVQEEMQHDDLRTDVVAPWKYDLLGKIATNTRLTRKTIAGTWVRLGQKSLICTRWIRKSLSAGKPPDTGAESHHHRRSYQLQRDERSYDSTIFTEEKHTSPRQGLPGQKSIVDYVFTDGTAKQSVERKFVEDLDDEHRRCRICQVAKRLPHSYPCG